MFGLSSLFGINLLVTPSLQASLVINIISSDMVKCRWDLQIGLYNSMVEKEGTDGEEEAIRAYIASRDESDHAAELAVGDKVSSALIDRV